MVVGTSSHVAILRLKASVVGTSLLVPFPIVAVHYKRIGEERIVLVVGDETANRVYDRMNLGVSRFLDLLGPLVDELIMRFFLLNVGEVTQYDIGKGVEYFSLAALLVQLLKSLGF